MFLKIAAIDNNLKAFIFLELFFDGGRVVYNVCGMNRFAANERRSKTTVSCLIVAYSTLQYFRFFIYGLDIGYN